MGNSKANLRHQTSIKPLLINELRARIWHVYRSPCNRSHNEQQFTIEEIFSSLAALQTVQYTEHVFSLAILLREPSIPRKSLFNMANNYSILGSLYRGGRGHLR
jgi:hypothetical protein